MAVANLARAGVIITLMAVSMPSHSTEIEALRVGLEAGVRRDNFDWNIAGNLEGGDDGENPDVPNVLSELTWRSLDIIETKIHGTYTIDRLFFTGNVHFGRIYDGSNQDSDYSLDNRAGEFSRSNNGTDGGVFGVSLGGGVRLTLRDLSSGQSELAIIPAVGFSYFAQELNIKDGYQTIPARYAGPFPDLASEYNAQWRTPWAGIQLEVTDQFARTFEIGVTLYRNAHYDADANWNLIDDFAHPVSFRHHAHGEGYGWNAGLRLPFDRDWNFTVRLEGRLLETDPGLDVTYLADGTSDSTQLNEVNWRMIALRIGVEGRNR